VVLKPNGHNAYPLRTKALKADALIDGQFAATRLNFTFQNETADAPKNIEFVKGDWSYVAKPVRAMNESCLKCHNDYVILDKLPNGQFKMRKRQVGDVNGVLLYAFRHRK